MYALVEISGKQFKAEKGSVLTVSRLTNAKGEKVEFASVVLLADKDNVKVGTPYVQGVSLKAVVEDHTRGRKVIVARYKSKKGSKTKYGHRQPYSVIKVEEIAGA